MQVTVRYFASLREAVGHERETVELCEGASVGDLHEQLQLARFGGELLSACNHSYCDRETILTDGDLVAFFPTVTGG